MPLLLKELMKDVDAKLGAYLDLEGGGRTFGRRETVRIGQCVYAATGVRSTYADRVWGEFPLYQYTIG